VGRTIIEPGISAAIAVLIGLLISGNFTVVNLIPVVSYHWAGVVGGWSAKATERFGSISRSTSAERQHGLRFGLHPPVAWLPG
jgi:hypothetical protein